MRRVLSKLSAALLRVAGWSIVGESEIRVGCHSVGVYCHTSAWDGIVGMLVACVLRERLGYSVTFVMRESLVGPVSLPVQRALGIAQVRRGRGGTVAQLTERFGAEPPTCVLISPEGSRNLTDAWHTGPSVLARSLNADVVVVGMDFGEHVVRLRRLDTFCAKEMKRAVERDSVPLFPARTALRVRSSAAPPSAVDWLVLTSYLMGLSVFVWEGGDAPRIAMALSAALSTAYHHNHEHPPALRAADHLMAWLAVGLAFRDYAIRGGAWLPRAAAWGLAFALKMASRSTTQRYRECARYRLYHSLFHLSILGIAIVS